MVPSPRVPRAYHSTRRRAAAEETRTRILEAARALLAGRGNLDDFSMETIAARAGVSRMTVYYQFESRSGLLDALADHLAQRGGMAQMREVFLEPSLPAAFRKLVETFVGFWASDRVTLRRMRAMAVVFPSDAAGPRDRDAWRREAIANLLEKHRPRGSRARAPVPAELVDTLAMLTSFEAFDLLCVGERGAAETAALLADLGLARIGAAAGYEKARHLR
jgi:AcrR family transcriptional regulator